jgi:N-acylneuraminate cytidylyltransferase
MIGDQSVLALLPARGGSKGLPGKNTMLLGDRPLLQWTIDAARGSRFIDRLVLSSDDDRIMEAAARGGCDVPFRRPADLASDNAAMIDVALHALESIPGYDILVLLQPTSPLRTSADIDAAFELFQRTGGNSCVSVSPVEQSPYWMYRVGHDGELTAILDLPEGVARRQDLPPVYALNGAIYISNVAALKASRSFVTRETVGYMMPAERSIDIDTAADFEAAKRALTEDANAEVS